MREKIMLAKLKQYPMTVLEVIIVFGIVCYFNSIGLFNQLALILLVWWVGYSFEKPINEMIQKEDFSPLLGRGFCFVATGLFAAVVLYIQIKF
ncbi:hypothetical protein [Ligilactobacillus apodemi]|nr:hypothetical protein [Ligilactobacillus apodemi]